MKYLKKLGFLFIEPFAMKKLRTASKIYQQGEFEKILKVYKRLIVSENRKSDIYENVFRILCLLRTNNSLWKGEYKALIASGELDFLGENDKKYIQLHMSEYLDISPEERSKFYDYEIGSVSKSTKELIPESQKIKNEHFLEFQQSDLDSIGKEAE
jgi:hypothetical protein